MRTPFLATFPIAETMATGVDITNAQGQAIINSSRPLLNHSQAVPKPSIGGIIINANAEIIT